MNEKNEIIKFLPILSAIQSLSKCNKRKVGALLFSEDLILIGGSYNGTINGSNNDCEDDTNKTKIETFHAEEKVIMNAASMGIATKNAILLVSYAPCEKCARLIIGSRIKTVYYKEEYKNNDGINLIKNTNTIIERVTND